MGTIYLIKNKTNGKVYVGQTTKPLKTRRDQHLRKLRKGTHSNKHLQGAFNSYGESAFEFEVLEHFDPEYNFSLNNLERYYIQFYNSKDPNFGYNLSVGGEHSSDEAKAKISRANKGKSGFHGKRHAKETKDTLRVHNTGRKHLPESRAKMSAANIGRLKTSEEKAKIRETTERNRNRKLLCSNGQIYQRPKEAALALNLCNRKVSKVANGEYSTTGGYSFQWISK